MVVKKRSHFYHRHHILLISNHSQHFRTSIRPTRTANIKNKIVNEGNTNDIIKQPVSYYKLFYYCTTQQSALRKIITPISPRRRRWRR
jgi:hypothetical protein